MEIVDICLTKDKQQRPTVNEILRKKIFREFLCDNETIFNTLISNNKAIEVKLGEQEIIEAYKEIKEERCLQMRKSVKFV